MTSFQTIVTELLLETDSSRTTLQVTQPDGTHPIVAEAVRHGMQQIRNQASNAELTGSSAFRSIDKTQDVLVLNDVEQANPALPRVLVDSYGVRAQMLAPLVLGGRLAGVLSVHHAPGARAWGARDLDAVRKAKSSVLKALEHREQQALSATASDLRDAAAQAILDRLRQTLGVQRCTFRQNVLAAYAFPVTHESRDNVRSLLGDFTIVQSGQPVIDLLLSTRAQVVQEDCLTASPDPLFHTMLEHYGSMRAQIVTPFIREDKLAGVLSIHNLKQQRTWTSEEKMLAKNAAELLGHLFATKLT
jgi:maleate isomerase